MKSLLLSLLTLFILSLFTSCQKSNQSSAIGPILEQYVGVWNGDSLSALDKIADKNFQLRIVPTFEPMTGIDKLKQEIIQTRASFPDFLITETEKLSVGDTAVVIRWDATGTLKGTDNKVTIPGFSVIFFHNGKLTGEWIAYSDLTMYKQLGYTIAPPEMPKK
jgi:SnoaL-like polyketide cyclase